MARLIPFPTIGSIGYRTALMSGEQGTEQTVKLMRQLIDQALTDQDFVRFAVDVVRPVAPYDELGELRAIYDWVQSNIRFTKDPVAKEKLYPPQELLKIEAGDCDDISMLMAAMVLALGYPARLVTVAGNGAAPDDFSHVYAEAEAPPGSGNWIPMDAARPGAQFGIPPPTFYRARTWSLVDDSYQEMAGLGGYTNGLGASWADVFQSAVSQVPGYIALAQGQYPYSSFVTPYSPGYGVPLATYAPPSAGSAWLSQNWPLLLVGVGAWLLMRRTA